MKTIKENGVINIKKVLIVIAQKDFLKNNCVKVKLVKLNK